MPFVLYCIYIDHWPIGGAGGSWTMLTHIYMHHIYITCCCELGEPWQLHAPLILEECSGTQAYLLAQLGSRPRHQVWSAAALNVVVHRWILGFGDPLLSGCFGDRVPTFVTSWSQYIYIYITLYYIDIAVISLYNIPIHGMVPKANLASFSNSISAGCFG